MAEHHLPRRVKDALRSAGASLTRSNRHLVYKFPNGRNVILSATASDHRAEQNMLRDIRRYSA